MTIATTDPSRPQPLFRRVARRAACALFALAATAAAGPAAATTADDLCPAAVDPCLVNTTIDVAPGSEIDVGTRQLEIGNRGALNLTGGTMTLHASDITVDAGGALLARGTANDPGGKIIAVADAITLNGTADASGGPGGAVTLTATAQLVVAGFVDVHSRSASAGGGSADLQGGDITISSGGRIRAGGGGNDSGGDITLRASGALAIGGDVDASGGDGGSIDCTAATTLTVGPNVSVNADATSTAGSGGDIDLSAIGAVVVNGELTADGRNGTDSSGGGDGGSVTILGSSIDVPLSAARITVVGGSPDGVGGDVDLTTNTGSISLRGQVLARSPGTDGNGGTVSIDAAGDAMLAGGIDASGGGNDGGDISISSGTDVSIASTASLTVAANNSGSGGNIDVSGGRLVAVVGTLTADGGNATGARGGAIDLSGCTVRIDTGGRLTSLRSGGTNTLIGSDLSLVAGTMRADPTSGRNVIRFAGAQYEPSILPGAQIDPPVAFIIDAAIVPCNPAATPTTTPTPLSATPTRTRTGTPTATPVARCVGDCNGDGTVIVNELVLGVNIALGLKPIGNCRAFDVNGDGFVTVNELIQGVANALNHCPA